MEEKEKITIEDAEVSYCFGCSKNNPHGLQMEFVSDNGTVETTFTPGIYHQSWPGMTHGGILFSLLDEAGGYALRSAGVNGVTARCETRFASPARCGDELKVTARVVKKTSRTVETEAFLHRQDGTLVASTSSLWYIVARI